jgi:bud site selection protein 20
MVDQIVLEDMLPDATQKLLNQKTDEEKPGLGQFYCVTCAQYFISAESRAVHEKTKQHKKRIKICLTEVPYTIEEAERAGGLMPAKKKTVTLTA